MVRLFFFRKLSLFLACTFALQTFAWGDPITWKDLKPIGDPSQPEFTQYSRVLEKTNAILMFQATEFHKLEDPSRARLLDLTTGLVRNIECALVRNLTLFESGFWQEAGESELWY